MSASKTAFTQAEVARFMQVCRPMSDDVGQEDLVANCAHDDDALHTSIVRSPFRVGFDSAQAIDERLSIPIKSVVEVLRVPLTWS